MSVCKGEVTVCMYVGGCVCGGGGGVTVSRHDAAGLL